MYQVVSVDCRVPPDCRELGLITGSGNIQHRQSKQFQSRLKLPQSITTCNSLVQSSCIAPASPDASNRLRCLSARQHSQGQAENMRQ